MKTAFLRISCFFLCFFGTSVALADGITSVAPGEDVVIHSNTTLEKPVSFEWVIFQNGIQQEKVEKETFSYRFAKEGEYDLVFSAHDAAGETESSTFRVLVNANPNQLLPLNAVLRTLPPTDEAGIIHIPKNIPSFWMIAEESAGDIVEYRFDKNLVVDSDGDGDPANDQDNPNPTQPVWRVDYSEGVAGDIPVRFSAVSATGGVSIRNRTVRIEDMGLEKKPVKAVVFSYPSADEQGIIHLSGDSSEVYFLLSLSEGDIIHYRVDENIAVDSSGDGNPANDIDNRTDPSLYRGTPFSLLFEKGKTGEQIVQFIVNTEDNKGSQIRRKIVFDGGNSASILETPEMNPQLVINHPMPFVGEEVTFTVLGAPLDALFSWDFNGDGTPEKSGTESIVKYTFITPGNVSPEVTVSAEDTDVFLRESLTVAPVPENSSEGNFSAPVADFFSVIEKEKVTFTNSSQADNRLADTTLQFLWDFGDEQTSTDASPVHSYSKPGTYSVVLSVTDTEGNTSQKEMSIEIAEVSEQSVTPTVALLTVHKGDGLEGEITSDPAGIVCGDTCSAPFSIGTKITLSSDSKNIVWSGCEDGVITLSEDISCTAERAETAETLPTPSSEEKKSNVLLLFFILLGTILFLLPGIFLVVRKIKSPDESFAEILEDILPGKKRSGIAPFAKPSPGAVSQESPEPSSVFRSVPPPVPGTMESTPGSLVMDTTTSSFESLPEQSDLAESTGEVPPWLQSNPSPIPEPSHESEEIVIPESPQEVSEEGFSASISEPEPVSSAPSAVPSWLREEEEHESPEENIPEEVPLPVSQEQKPSLVPEWLREDTPPLSSEELSPQAPEETISEPAFSPLPQVVPDEDVPPTDLESLHDVPDFREGEDEFSEDIQSSPPFVAPETKEETSASPVSEAFPKSSHVSEIPDWVREEVPPAPVQTLPVVDSSPQQQESSIPEWLQDDSVDSPTASEPVRKEISIPKVPPFVPPLPVEELSPVFPPSVVPQKPTPPPAISVPPLPSSFSAPVPPDVPQNTVPQQSPRNIMTEPQNMLSGEVNLPPIPSGERKEE